jgi:hypothetical protein
MSTSQVTVSDLVANIDRNLFAAYLALVRARAGLARCPSTGGQRDCEAAEADLNDLLELRSALTLPSASNR